GVSSRELCGGMIDKMGLNKGLSELASGAEVMAYFDKVMKHTFLPSGRVQYFPMCEYQGDGKFSSLLSDISYEVKVNKKIIDGTYFKTSVPATHTPNFE
ncbi:NAD(P)/FAD-dependent oxidoreductase, partial [Pseudoalteromonas sp. SIMBA_153]